MERIEPASVKNLSDRRLWEILHQCEAIGPCVASALVEHAREELCARRQDDATRRFRTPQ